MSTTIVLGREFNETKLAAVWLSSFPDLIKLLVRWKKADGKGNRVEKIYITTNRFQ